MNEQMQEAHRAYYRLLAVIDPLRFRFWDSREVTMTQLRVMFLIRARCEPTTGEVAEAMHIRPATLTGLADRLEAKHLVHRWPDPSDRRLVRVGLTDAGVALLDEASDAARAFLDAAFERMGPDAVDAFICAANAFITAADAAPAATTAPDPAETVS